MIKSFFVLVWFCFITYFPRCYSLACSPEDCLCFVLFSVYGVLFSVYFTFCFSSVCLCIFPYMSCCQHVCLLSAILLIFPSVGGAGRVLPDVHRGAHVGRRNLHATRYPAPILNFSLPKPAFGLTAFFHKLDHDSFPFVQSTILNPFLQATWAEYSLFFEYVGCLIDIHRGNGCVSVHTVDRLHCCIHYDNSLLPGEVGEAIGYFVRALTFTERIHGHHPLVGKLVSFLLISTGI